MTSCFVYKVMGLILPQTALKRDCNGNALSESRVITFKRDWAVLSLDTPVDISISKSVRQSVFIHP